MRGWAHFGLWVVNIGVAVGCTLLAFWEKGFIPMVLPLYGAFYKWFVDKINDYK